MSTPSTPPSDWTPVQILTLDEVCDRYINYALDRCGGDVKVTARILGIGVTTLYRHLHKLGYQSESAQPRINFNANSLTNRKAYPTTNQRGQCEASSTACLET